MLEVADLARRYGDVVALDGLSFTVEPGQLVALVGPRVAEAAWAAVCREA